MTTSARTAAPQDRIAFLAALALLVAAGCGQSPPPTGIAIGTVTLDGRPVANGTIAFLPTDGTGPTAGAVIAQGAYRVEQLYPGRKIVRIEAFGEEVAFPRSRADMEKVPGRPARPTPSSPPADPNLIPPDATGNNAEVTVAAGTQPLDFHVKSRTVR